MRALTANKVKSILKNPLYMGRPKYGKKYGSTEVIDPDLAFVDEKLFFEVQETITRKESKRRGQKGTERFDDAVVKKYGVGYTLRMVSNLIYHCDKCQNGHMVRHGLATVRGRTVSIYRCTQCGHKTKIYTGAMIDKFIGINLMICPYCWETEYFGIEGPLKMEDLMVYRYRCKNCGGIFFSQADPNKYLRRYPFNGKNKETKKNEEREGNTDKKRGPLDPFLD